MPEIRAFRALRFNPETLPDLSRVVAPPYDVISLAQRIELAAREPHNVVAIDVPVDGGAADPDEKYRQAARTFAGWRSDGTLRKDRQPSLYVYEQEYTLPGTSLRRVQRGFFGRLRLEAFGPDGGVLPHERTLAGPKEDRYKLMRATGANFSAVMVLYDDATGAARRLLAEATDTPAVADVTDDDGVRHRLWMVPDDGPTAPLVAGLVEAAGRAPVTIADGHHRYETALRYRDERRITRAGEESPPFDYVLALFMDATTEPLLALPTHRVARAVSVADGLVEAASSSGLFDVDPADRAALLGAFGPEAQAPGGRGRIGLWTRAGGAVLTARREAFAPLLPAGGEAVRRLDVTLLAAALERLCGIDRAGTTSGSRIGYTKDAGEAIGWVDERIDAADAAFLLEATPVAEIAAVAREGDVMPQKSTYFFPKPVTGFVLNPLEW
ncbi:MAG TPA: DUF1015 domain-containing protein [Candidatus Nanopelagicales bacterium]|nr:DUF1015 domain-containing protein [Candidatus Nanopelagicales bacterium]